MVVIYNWTTGIVDKVLHLIIGPISSLFRIGDLAVLGENHALRFVDTKDDVEFKMMNPIETHCKFVSCMEMVPAGESATYSKVLIYGGTDSGNVNLIRLDENMRGRIIRI